MGTATYRGKGFKERTRVSGKRPIAATSLRQYSTQGCQPSPLPSAEYTRLSTLLIRNLIVEGTALWIALPDGMQQPFAPDLHLITDCFL